MLSNLVRRHLPKIISDTEQNHLLKRPGDIKIIQGVSSGFYSAIEKLKKEKEGKL